jgi:hypothetical protein
MTSSYSNLQYIFMVNGSYFYAYEKWRHALLLSSLIFALPLSISIHLIFIGIDLDMWITDWSNFVCFSRWTNNLLEIKDYFSENNDECVKNIVDTIENCYKYKVNEIRFCHQKMNCKKFGLIFYVWKLSFMKSINSTLFTLTDNVI